MQRGGGFVLGRLKGSSVLFLGPLERGGSGIPGLLHLLPGFFLGRKQGGSSLVLGGLQGRSRLGLGFLELRKKFRGTFPGMPQVGLKPGLLHLERGFSLETDGLLRLGHP